MDFHKFFEEQVPVALLRSDGLARQGGILFVLDGERWLVDLSAAVSRRLDDAPVEVECQLQMAGSIFERLLADPTHGQRICWEGGVRASGNHALLGHFFASLGSTPAAGLDAFAAYYDALAHLVPDDRFRFMNHCYATGPDPFDWLEPGDRAWGYAIALARHVVGDESLAGKQVLDVGCGRGGVSSYLRRYHHPAQVIGLDRCAAAVEHCSRDCSLDGLQFVVGDALALPFPKSSFDVVVNIESAHCYGDTAGFLREVSRVLRPGGSFCFADVFLPDRLAATREALQAERSLRLLRDDDITSEVARGIALNDGSFMDLLLSMVDEGGANQAILSNLIYSINVSMRQKYESGEWRYASFWLRRVEPVSGEGTSQEA